MVKVHGIRVDPGEPEYQLRQLGAIFHPCVVDWIHDEQENVKMTAFVEVGRSEASSSRNIDDGNEDASGGGDAPGGLVALASANDTGEFGCYVGRKPPNVTYMIKNMICG